MFQHNFEFGGGTLISLRSLALALTLLAPLAGQVETGCCPNPFSRFLSDESGKGRSSLLKNLFSRILKLGSTANPKLSARGGSDSWICGRYASLRIASEKILIRAQSFPSHFLAIYS
jgi:hypothetical protein